MIKLSIDNFERAWAFILSHARPLDRRLFEYSFEAGPAEAVLGELARYQNADGGFGHALEPDFRLTASSPMATSIALQYAAEVGAEAGHPLIQGAVRYLVDTCQAGGSYWPATFMDVNEEPHAPWWGLEKLKIPEEREWANPSAELVGYLHRYVSLVEPGFLEKVTRQALTHIAAGSPPYSSYDLICFQRTLPFLPQGLGEAVRIRLSEGIARFCSMTLQELQQDLMEVRIFWLAPSPGSPFARLASRQVEALLDWEIGQQATDGGWWPTWEWGQYPEAWAIARLEWAGKMTVDCLRSLREFKRLEG